MKIVFEQKVRWVAVALLLAGLAAPAQAGTPEAAGPFYAVAGLQYSELKDIDISALGYSIGAGWQLSPQWALELTAVEMMDSSEALIGFTVGSRIQSRGVGLAALGRTALQPNLQLFYRAGVHVLKHQASWPYVQSVIKNGNTTTTSIGYTEVDATKTHAVLGLGLEQRWSANWSGRIEAEHTFKNDGISFSTARLSAIYRF